VDPLAIHFIEQGKGFQMIC